MLYTGHVLDILKSLPANSVHTCITSPPYYGLRTYGTEPQVWGGDPTCTHDWLSKGMCANGCGAWLGHLGLEPTYQMYISHLVSVFAEVYRVLREDGTLWVNIGDSYNAAGRKTHGTRIGRKQGTNRASANGNDSSRPSSTHLKPKDLLMIPARLAISLQDWGWYLRSDIIWAKPNPMPESVMDRPTKSHEHLFLLAKSESYYYDSQSIREPSITCDPRHLYTSKGAWDIDGRPIGQRHGGKPRTAGNHNHKYVTEYESSDSEEHRTKAGLLKVADVPWETRNKRDVWSVTPQPYPGAHFAVMPEKLVDPCVLAGCPPSGTVLDPFCGSGTVGVSARRHNREFIGIDLKPEYVEMARDRIASITPNPIWTDLCLL